MTVDLSIALTAGGLVVTTSGSLVCLGWWLSGQFRKQEAGRERLKDQLAKHLDEVRDAIDDQIRYHERLDDQRFSEMEKRFTAIDLAIMKIEFREEREGKIVGPHQI